VGIVEVGEEEEDVRGGGGGGGVVDDDDVRGVCNAMFHPTTAMAPTTERWLRVVVAVDQASDSPSGVEA
jgi:hypothetical protein